MPPRSDTILIHNYIKINKLCIKIVSNYQNKNKLAIFIKFFYFFISFIIGIKFINHLASFKSSGFKLPGDQLTISLYTFCS
jgi:hypothetical protein